MPRPAYIFILASLLAVNISSFAQTRDQKIAAIRQEFHKISRDSLLKSFTLNDPEDFLGEATDGGGNLRGFFKNDTLVRITLTVGVSYGEKSEDFYFRNGKLIFVYETEMNFPHDSLGFNYEKIVLVFEGRYYFDNDKLIDKIQKGKRLIQKDISPRELLDEATKFSKLLTARRK